MATPLTCTFRWRFPWRILWRTPAPHVVSRLVRSSRPTTGPAARTPQPRRHPLSRAPARHSRAPRSPFSGTALGFIGHPARHSRAPESPGQVPLGRWQDQAPLRVPAGRVRRDDLRLPGHPGPNALGGARQHSPSHPAVISACPGHRQDQGPRAPACTPRAPAMISAYPAHRQDQGPRQHSPWHPIPISACPGHQQDQGPRAPARTPGPPRHPSPRHSPSRLSPSRRRGPPLPSPATGPALS